MKRKLILLILVFIFVCSSLLGGYFYLNKLSLDQSGTYGQLKPFVTTTLNSRKFVKTATSPATFSAKDKILGAKVILPTTVITTSKGNEWLVLINKKIRLPANFVPNDLVLISEISAPAGSLLRSQAYIALKKMFVSAKNEGIALTVTSAYRSFQQQVSIFNSWVSLAGLKSAESFSAKAGFSQHQLGSTVDIGAIGKSNLNDAFGVSTEGVWLANNSYKFGFVLSYPKGKEKITGYNYEPWHFRYIGVGNAQTMINSNMILEEFLQKFGTW